MKYKDVILVNREDYEKAIATLEDAGVELFVLNTRFVDRNPDSD